MTLTEWIPLAITLVTLAATWGEVRARLKAVEKSANDTAREVRESRGDQGRRLGLLGDRVAHVEGFVMNGPYRRTSTAARGIPISAAPPEDSEGTE